MNYKSFFTLLLGCMLAALPAFSAFADEPVISYTNEHSVLTSLDVTCAPTDIVGTPEGTLLVTDDYAKVAPMATGEVKAGQDLLKLEG